MNVTVRIVQVAASAAILLTTATAQVPQIAETPRVLLPGEEVEFMAPLWSPAGDRIAFTSGGFTGLWVLNLEGGEVALVSDEPAAGFGFEWSPDGGALLTRVAEFDGPRRSNAVKVFDLETGETQQLTDYRTSMPALPRWAGDGSRVVLQAEGHLEVYDTGRSVDPSKVLAAAPTFVVEDMQLARVDPVSGVLRMIGPFAGARVVELVSSPNRSKAAIRVVGEGLFVVSADGEQVAALGNGNFPTWSPDGNWVAFARIEDDGHVLTSADLYVASADGAVSAPLTDTEEAMELFPTWSPDGNWIAYSDRGTLFRARLSMP